MKDAIVVGDYLETRVKKEDILFKGDLAEDTGDFTRYDLKYTIPVKNLLFSCRFKGNKKNDGEIFFRYYIRFADADNYSLLTIKNGQFIQFTTVSKGETVLKTSEFKITADNLFTQKFDLIVSLFEESLTVIIDSMIVMSIEHVPEEAGTFFITFTSPKKDNFETSLESIGFSEEILHFEPIIEMNKNPDAYFMEANDFYEQNRYDLALYYYKKGVLFGRGDDKIYNRIGNLQFLIENYPSAEFYYKLAKNAAPDNREYRINYIRTLIKQNNADLFVPLLKEFEEAGDFDKELFIDYAGYLITKKEFELAAACLERIKEQAAENPAFRTKYGRVLIETGKVEEGKEILFQAADALQKKDPSSAVIILTYSLEKKRDFKSIKLLAELLYQAGEFREIFNLLTNAKAELFFDAALFEMLLDVETKLEQFPTVLNEFDRIDPANIVSSHWIYKLIALTSLGRYEEALPLAEQIYADEAYRAEHINIILREIFRLAGLSKVIPENCDRLAAEALVQQPGYDDAIKEYTKLLVDLCEYEKALPLLEKLIKKMPNDQDLQYNIGITLDGLGDYAGARPYLTKLYAETNSAQIVFVLAHTLYYGRFYNEALQLLLSNYDRLPPDGKVDNLVANTYLSLGSITEAQRYYYTALERDEDNEEYALNLAESFYKMKDFESTYKITSQIIKKGSFDRAMTLHLKTREHLFTTVKCSVCGARWDIAKSKHGAVKAGELDHAGENGPAGTCQKCGKIYCKQCAPSNETGAYICPDDHIELIDTITGDTK